MEYNKALLSRLTVKSDKRILFPVMAFIKLLAKDFGFNESDADKLVLVTKEACTNVIKHAFNGSEDELFDITVEKGNGCFIIGVEDKGLPFDFDSEEKGRSKGFGLTIMRECTDGIRFMNLGNKGKRVELLKKLPSSLISTQEFSENTEASKTDVSKTEFEFRLMRADEYLKLEQLVYKTYGYTYLSFVYFPERIKEMIENGLLQSNIAITSEGVIAGHAAVEKLHKDSKVAEFGMLMVDPLYRDMHLGKRLMNNTIENARQQGILGLYSEAVTIHTYSQKTILDSGGKETGIMLGYISKELSFRKIRDEQPARQSAVLIYTKINPEPERPVWLPREHSAVIKKIYDYAGIKRKYKKTLLSELKFDEQSVIDVTIQQDFNIAHMEVLTFGNDIEKALRIHLRELLIHRIDVIYLNISLSNPAAEHFNKTIESLGFIFCGIVPEYREGDILRYQYLNNIDLNMESTEIVSDMGKELFDYVMKYYK
ncbi:MAG: GNAT family N-acetyltransferase [Paludibacter sp.]